MEERKELGKIDKVSFGVCRDRGYLLGINFTLTFGGGSSGCNTSHQVNMSEWNKNCKWSISEQEEYIVKMAWYVKNMLEESKVNDISQLKGIPIEATFKNYNELESFRILTEVL